MDTPLARPTIVDVAKAAGVSKSLVSLAIRDSPGVSASTRAHILEVAQRLGYRSNAWARSLARGRSHLIGVLLNDLHSGYHTDIVNGVEDAAADAGFGVVLSHGRRDGDVLAERLEALAALGVEGVVIVSGQVRLDALTRAATGRPVVVVGRPDAVPDAVSQVSNDDRLGARLAVHHLAALGHRRIAHVASSRRRAALDRAESYAQTMRELGLAEWVRTVAPDEVARVAAGIAAREPDAPTAVFAANDRLAGTAVGAAFDAGVVVPAQLSVVGYDDTELARMLRPALTSVDQPRAAMGRRAMELLSELLGGGAARREVIEPTLVVRDSTGAIGPWRRETVVS